MAENLGTARTVGELRKLLTGLPDELPVRTQTLSHEWPVEVWKHERCIMLTA